MSLVGQTGDIILYGMVITTQQDRTDGGRKLSLSFNTGSLALKPISINDFRVMRGDITQPGLLSRNLTHTVVVQFNESTAQATQTRRSFFTLSTIGARNTFTHSI